MMEPAVLAIDSTPNKTGLEQGELIKAKSMPMKKGGTLGMRVTSCGNGILIKPSTINAMKRMKIPMTR